MSNSKKRNSKNPRAMKFSWRAFAGMLFTLFSNIGLSFVGFFEAIAEMCFSSANHKLQVQRFHEDVTRDIESLNDLEGLEE